MFRTTLLELFLPIRPFYKKTANIYIYYISAKQNGSLLRREKQARQLGTC